MASVGRPRVSGLDLPTGWGRARGSLHQANDGKNLLMKSSWNSSYVIASKSLEALT